MRGLTIHPVQELKWVVGKLAYVVRMTSYCSPSSLRMSSRKANLSAKGPDKKKDSISLGTWHKRIQSAWEPDTRESNQPGNRTQENPIKLAKWHWRYWRHIHTQNTILAHQMNTLQMQVYVKPTKFQHNQMACQPVTPHTKLLCPPDGIHQCMSTCQSTSYEDNYFRYNS